MLPQSPASAPAGTSSKIYYLDYIKVLLTGLVILHHACIVYGAPGGWYFRQPTTSAPAKLGLTLFVATNQSFFMGLFFFLSAYFIDSSYRRKGAMAFTLDRLKRLGIPLLFYSLILSTAMNFLVYRYGLHQPATLGQYLAGYDDWIDPGVLWFVAALLLFTLIYAALRQRFSGQFRMRLPGPKSILLFAVGLGFVSFLVRLVFPIGWVLHPVGFQLCYFPQYIAFFGLGIVAQQNRWLDQLSIQQAKRFVWLALFLVIVVLPLLLVVSTRLQAPADQFSGGWTWQALSLSLWEQLTGLSISMALLSYGKHYWNVRHPALDRLARYTYGVYVFHPLIIIVLSLLLSDLPVDPLAKLAVVAPLSVIGSFLTGRLILSLPGAKQIL